MTNSNLLIRAALQIALLGAVTPNLRGVNALIQGQNLIIKFYYEHPPDEEEEDLAEIVGTEVYASLVDFQVEVMVEILPKSVILPEEGLRVYHRQE